MVAENTCVICQYASSLGAVAKHHVIPKSVTEGAGGQYSRTVSLCCNCHFELHNWYRKRVSDAVYDPGSKTFKTKSLDKIVKDYESAFNEFMRYKQTQKGKSQNIDTSSPLAVKNIKKI